MSKHSLNHSYFVATYNFANEINAYAFRESLRGTLFFGNGNSKNWSSGVHFRFGELEFDEK